LLLSKLAAAKIVPRFAVRAIIYVIFAVKELKLFHGICIDIIVSGNTNDFDTILDFESESYKDNYIVYIFL
jgi:hypothetical protein